MQAGGVDFNGPNPSPPPTNARLAAPEILALRYLAGVRAGPATGCAPKGKVGSGRERDADMEISTAHALPSRVAVIINPRSGSSRAHRSNEERRQHALGLFRDQGLAPVVLVTEHPGHARDLATRAIAEGADWVFAWGGDGTVNEVASVVAFSRATLAVIPSGSGNGLAGEFGIPGRPGEAIRAAIEGRERVIDVGEINGRLFFNVAGLGFDAHVAHCFSVAAGGRRGKLPYFWTSVREAFRFRPQRLVIDAEGRTLDVRVLLVSLANGRQWGSGAIIAPRAQPDDGKLELVVVASRWPVATLASAWRLFTGSFDRAPNATSLRVQSVSIRSDEPIAIHVDGEPIGHDTEIRARIHPAALKIRVPTRTGSPA
jgi:diacylglycerol kinase (ATP)